MPLYAVVRQRAVEDVGDVDDPRDEGDVGAGQAGGVAAAVQRSWRERDALGRRSSGLRPAGEDRRPSRVRLINSATPGVSRRACSGSRPGSQLADVVQRAARATAVWTSASGIAEPEAEQRVECGLIRSGEAPGSGCRGTGW